MKPYLFVFDAVSMPGSRHGSGKRAFVDMFVFADSRKQAENRAICYLNHSEWINIMVLAAYESYGPPPSWDERWVKAYRRAEYLGVGFHVGVLPTVPQGAQGGEQP